MNKQDKIYLAGVFDARLRLTVRNDGGLQAWVYGADRSLADTIQRLCGCGSVHKHGQGWRWSLGDCEKLRDTLAKPEPYMLVKQEAVQRVQAAADARLRELARKRDLVNENQRRARKGLRPKSDLAF